MGVDPEKIKQAKVQPQGWYKLKLVGFKPKLSANKQSVNINAQFEVLNSAGPDFVKFVFNNMNTLFDKNINDIVHGLGFALEKDGSLPGNWIKDAKDPDNVEKWQYQGPLIGRTMECELAIKPWNGSDQNRIRQVRCTVPDCAVKFPDIRHQTNMLGKDK
jgi:hypothetical protein